MKQERKLILLAGKSSFCQAKEIFKANGKIPGNPLPKGAASYTGTHSIK